MYRSLKNNFSSVCLDSVFLNTFSSRKANVFPLVFTSIHMRRRVTFFAQLRKLRNMVVQHVQSFALLQRSERRVCASILRNLKFISFIRCFGVKSASYIKYLASFIVARKYPKFKFNVKTRVRVKSKFKRRSSTAGSAFFTFLRFFYTTIRKRAGKAALLRVKATRRSAVRLPYDIKGLSSSLFFNAFFRKFSTCIHEPIFYFVMGMRECRLEREGGVSNFFLKKLIRLYFYQMGLHFLSSKQDLFVTNFKRVVTASFLFQSGSGDHSGIVYSLGLRFFSRLIFKHSRFMRYVTSNMLCIAPVMSIRQSLSIGLRSFKRSYTNVFVSFFKFIHRFSHFILARNYYTYATTLKTLNRTFNLFVNNSSARNVFSALSKGTNLLYGTTSGSFKLRKRVRYRKHAMFMVAAKFYRTISYYFKAKAVRAVNLCFTGYRRSFLMVFQFFRTLFRKNLKYHALPMKLLHKNQPITANSISAIKGASHVSSFFHKALPLRLKDVSFSNKMRSFEHTTLQLSKFSSNGSSFFYSNCLPLLQRKPVVLASARYYVTSTSYPCFKYTFVKNSVLPSSSFFPEGVSVVSLNKAMLLSPWLYASVYFSIIRTRRQYKSHKKLISPLFAHTVADCFAYDLSSLRSTRSFLRFLRSRVKYGIASSFRFFQHNAYVHYFSIFNSASSSLVRRYGTSSITDTGGNSFKRKRKRYRKRNRKRRLRIHKKKKRSVKFNKVRYVARLKTMNAPAYLSVFRTRMAVFINTILTGSSLRYRPVIAHGGCYKRKRISDRRYWF